MIHRSHLYLSLNVNDRDNQVPSSKLNLALNKQENKCKATAGTLAGIPANVHRKKASKGSTLAETPFLKIISAVLYHST